MRPRKAGLSSALDAPITSLVGLRAKTFAEPRLPEKVTKPVERAGAATKVPSCGPDVAIAARAANRRAVLPQKAGPEGGEN